MNRQKKELKKAIKKLFLNRRRVKPVKSDSLYDQIWREVDGQLISVYDAHSDYFNSNIKFTVIRASMCKRIVGKLYSALRDKTLRES